MVRKLLAICMRSPRVQMAFLSALSLVLVSAFQPAVCSAAPTTPIILEVAAFPSVDQIVKAAIPAWHAAHPNVEIRLVSRELADHHTSMATALATRSHLPDVMAIEIGYLGRFANSGGFVDLSAPPYRIQEIEPLLVPYAYAQARARDGSVRAVPADIAPGTLFYRTDVLQRAGVTPQELTSSWDGFVAAGRKIHARTGAYLVADARDIKDVMIRIHLQPGEGLYFDPAGHSALASERFRRAFRMARQVRREQLDAHSKAWSSDWSELLRSGRVATQMMGAWFGGHLENWLAPETHGKWRVSDLPEQSFAAWGGTFYAIPAHAPHPDLAFQFIRMLTLDRDRQLAAARDQDAFPALLAAQSDPFFDAPMPFFGNQQARQIWRQAALQIQPVPVNSLDPIAAALIDAALDKVLLHDASIDAVLEQASRQLQRRLDLIQSDSQMPGA